MLLKLDIILRIVALQKTQYGSDWQVLADIQNLRIKLKRQTVWQTNSYHKTGLERLHRL